MTIFSKSKYISNPRLLTLAILTHFFKWLPDKSYLKINYYLHMGEKLDLKNPTTFNEKLQWLKLYYHRPDYTNLVDKIEVKKYVASKIGDQYVIPTFGVWDSFDEINLESLPDKFILKTNHDGGGIGVVFCHDKDNHDWDSSKQLLKKSLKNNIYINFREWPYKNVRRRILAEKMLEPKEGAEIQDFKFFCFNGQPKVMLVSHGRFTDKGVCFDYYDMNFNKLPFEQGGPNSGIEMEKPKGFEKMKELAAILSEGMPHVRVDFYNIDGDIYFGELTFFDSSGMAKFNPEKWNRIFGDWITLPEKII